MSQHLPQGLRLQYLGELGYTVGCDVVVERNNRETCGIVRFIGYAKFAPGPWIGVELVSKTGKNDGSVDGHRYFRCAYGQGLFVRPDKVYPNHLDVPRHDTALRAPNSPAHLPATPPAYAESQPIQSQSRTLTPSPSRTRQMRRPAPVPVVRLFDDEDDEEAENGQPGDSVNGNEGEMAGEDGNVERAQNQDCEDMNRSFGGLHHSPGFATPTSIRLLDNEPRSWKESLRRTNSRFRELLEEQEEDQVSD